MACAQQHLAARTGAPAAEGGEAARRTRTRVMVVDSRDRDFSAFPSSADVAFVPAEPLRAVRRISLVSFVCHFPSAPGDPPTDVYLALAGLQSHSPDAVRFPVGVQGPPGGAVALAVLNGCNFAAGWETDGLYYYRTPTANPDENSVSFPSGANVPQLRFQLFWYNRPSGASVGAMEPLPSGGYAWYPSQNAYSKESNWRAVLKIEIDE